MTIADLKSYLSKQFHTKDLGTFHHFLKIELILLVCQRKYIIYLMFETNLLGAQPVDTPMDSTGKQGNPFLVDWY